MDEEKRLTRKKNILLSVVSVVILCILLFPLYWALITSLKTEQEIFQNPPTFYPHVLNSKSYAAQVETGDFNMFRSFANSFLISVWATVIAVLLAVPLLMELRSITSREEKSCCCHFWSHRCFRYQYS